MRNPIQRIAESVVKFFGDKRSKELIGKLIGSGIKIKYPDLSHKTDKLVGNTFVLTGTLDTLSRDDAKKLIEQNGGKVLSSVSGKTSYVIAGENPGSKLDKAEKLGVKIINEAEFKKLL